MFCGVLFCKTNAFSGSHIARSGHSWPSSRRGPGGVLEGFRRGPEGSPGNHESAPPPIMVPQGVPEGSGGVPRVPEGPRGGPGGVPMGSTGGPGGRKVPDPHVADPHVRGPDVHPIPIPSSQPVLYLPPKSAKVSPRIPFPRNTFPGSQTAA